MGGQAGREVIIFLGERMSKEHVVVNWNKFQINEINGRLVLNLSDLEIKDICEIEGLGTLSNLHELDLSHNRLEAIWGLDDLIHLQILHLEDNEITEIQGLDHLSELKELYLQDNKISELEGLGTLSNLQTLDLSGNPIKKSQRALLKRSPQDIVRYCFDSLPEKERQALSKINVKRYCINCGFYVTDEEDFCPVCEEMDFLEEKEYFLNAIRVEGDLVIPRWVEQILCEHPAILECGVLGIPDLESGEESEKVKAFIVLQKKYRGKIKERDIIEWANEEIKERDILGWAYENLFHYKAPRVVEFVTNLKKFKKLKEDRLRKLATIRIRELAEERQKKRGEVHQRDLEHIRQLKLEKENRLKEDQELLLRSEPKRKLEAEHQSRIGEEIEELKRVKRKLIRDKEKAIKVAEIAGTAAKSAKKNEIEKYDSLRKEALQLVKDKEYRIKDIETKIKNKQERPTQELVEERSERFQKIIQKYDEISVKSMARLLWFDDPIALEEWLIEVFFDSPLRIKGNKVIIHSGGTAEVEAEIDALLTKYKEWEDRQIGKK